MATFVKKPSGDDMEALDSKLRPLVNTEKGMLGFGLHRLAENEVGKRTEIEQRWLEDTRQFIGRYDPEVEAAISSDRTKSSAFVNITRPKANAAEQRMSDMLFPTDDKNWGIKPTPVPEISNETENATPTGEETEEGNEVTEGDMAQGFLDEARARSDLMEMEIDDQLKESRFNSKCRDVIHDSMMLGTGILKGPIIVGQIKRKWKQVEGSNVFEIQIVEEPQPGVERVDPWNFFPEMDAVNIASAAYVFERHYMMPREILRMRGLPGFDTEQVDALLRDDPKHWKVRNQRLQERREISGLNVNFMDRRYEVWEYHGPLDRDQLELCGCDLPVEDELLDSFEAVVIFCGPYVLKAVVNPMDTHERPYSVFNWQKDDASIFGFGIPYECRHAQKVVNGSWRMLMQNSALTVGPQIVVNQMVEPMDGNYKLTPMKIWQANDPNMKISEAFWAFDIPSKQAELTAIFQEAKRLADEETSLPVFAQGEQRSNNTLPHTLGAFAILMNNANIMIRRGVKNWDDDITDPIITRFYNWNMQFNPKDEIKGDFVALPRGTSTLLVKEMQAQTLMQMAQFADSPTFGHMIKGASYLRKMFQTTALDPDEIMFDDAEIQTKEKEKAAAAQQPDQAAQSRVKAAEIMANGQVQVAQINFEARMAEAGVKEGMKFADIEARLTEHREKMQADRDAFVQEAQLKAAMGEKGNYGLEVNA